MTIRKANEVNPQKKIRTLIYGVPGIAKSTTALSAPAPLMVDADYGWDRIPALFRRGDYIQPKTYEELLIDLVVENVKPYETIVFDTGGALLNLMKAWAIKRDPKNGQRDNTTLSMRGYGAVGQEFARLMDYCFKDLNKHVIVVFHAKEEMDGDQKVFRLDVEGQTRNNIWKNMDLGGFFEAQGDRRIVSFSPSDRFFAKGTHGIIGTMEIPNIIKGGATNDFMSKLFTRVNDSIAEDMKLVEKYDALMITVSEIVSNVADEKTAAQAMIEIQGLDYVFAAKSEAWHLLKAQAESVGLVYNSASKAFEVKK